MGSCDTLLNDYFLWGNEQNLNEGKALVDCSIVSNQGDTVVSFATGVLEFSAGEIALDVVEIPPKFTGELVRRFSDRRGSDNVPFDSQYGDKIRVTISGGKGPVVHLSPSTIAIESVSPGNVTFGFEVQCLAGIIYGVGKPVSSNVTEALYLISIGNRHYVVNEPPTS